MTSGKLVVFQGPGQAFQLQSAEVRALLPGEVLVKNRYTTLCGSDLHTFCGLRKEVCPTVLGHEIVGEVMAIHPAHSGSDHNGKQLRVGDVVTWSIFSSDPESYYALHDMPQKGDNLFKYGHAKVENVEVFHGGLAEYCILKAHTAILKLPREIPLPIAATLNCAIATVAGALRIAGNLEGKNVLITGMGLLGMTCAAMCKDAGAAWIIAADITEKRLEEAMGFGADETIDLKKDNVKLPAKGIDVVFDMSGSADAMEFGIDSLAIGGSAILIGAVFNTRKLQVDAEKVIRKLLTIKGLHNYNYQDFTYALDFITRNWEKYPFGQVVGKEFSLNEVQEAFEYAVQFKPLRVGIRI
ncbi:zinc-binding dehydrogenase [Chitinophaga niabensis]|uniref:alcohol dehydrogenase n=1 Tax=Chitinophaga niabensis TaxID=536979 RepID=A0A1N6K8U8_9BACT|nr:zinc-binding dehydrogenase [Chitinophaga niabensis]SIO53000.1 alcohol dehydrogenase [Chitinophaga niabensis]